MVKLKKIFGSNLRRSRKTKGLTQEKLSEKAKISVDMISLIERGINAPSFKNIEKLSKSLEVKAYKFFTE